MTNRRPKGTLSAARRGATAGRANITSSAKTTASGAMLHSAPRHDTNSTRMPLSNGPASAASAHTTARIAYMGGTALIG